MIPLYRFKSNPLTIVQHNPNNKDSDRIKYVNVVWSNSYRYGNGAPNMYILREDNLERLTDEECAAVWEERRKYDLNKARFER